MDIIQTALSSETRACRWRQTTERLVRNFVQLFSMWWLGKYKMPRAKTWHASAVWMMSMYFSLELVDSKSIKCQYKQSRWPDTHCLRDMIHCQHKPCKQFCRHCPRVDISLTGTSGRSMTAWLQAMWATSAQYGIRLFQPQQAEACPEDPCDRIILLVIKK